MISDKKQRELLSKLTKEIDRISTLKSLELRAEIRVKCPSIEASRYDDKQLVAFLCKEHAYRVFDPETSKLSVRRETVCKETVSDPHQCERCGINLTEGEASEDAIPFCNYLLLCSHCREAVRGKIHKATSCFKKQPQ